MGELVIGLDDFGAEFSWEIDPGQNATEAELPVLPGVGGPKMRPEGLQVLFGFFRPVEAGEDDREHRIQDQVMIEGLIEARIPLAIRKDVDAVEDQLAIQKVIPVFADAGLVLHRLAFPSHQILIKGNREISDRPGIGHRGVHEIVVLVADVLRKDDLRGPEDLRLIHRGMQGQIAFIGEFAEVAPTAGLALFEEIGVLDPERGCPAPASRRNP